MDVLRRKKERTRQAIDDPESCCWRRPDRAQPCRKIRSATQITQGSRSADPGRRQSDNRKTLLNLALAKPDLCSLVRISIFLRPAVIRGACSAMGIGGLESETGVSLPHSCIRRSGRTNKDQKCSVRSAK